MNKSEATSEGSLLIITSLLFGSLQVRSAPAGVPSFPNVPTNIVKSLAD